MTAAHCVNETRPALVRLGDSDLSTDFDCLDVEEGCYSEGWAEARAPSEHNFFCLTARLAMKIRNVLLAMWTMSWKMSSFTRNSPLRG